MFYIGFREGEYSDKDHDLPTGRIIAGNLDENFESITTYWSKKDYRQSWQGQLEGLISGNHVALIFTFVVSPKTANFLRGFDLYRFDKEVLIHERMVFMRGPFKRRRVLDNPEKFVPSYRSSIRHGRPSEWKISIDDIREFLTGPGCQGFY